MARRSAADIQKAKEAKQKKLLLALLPFFLLLVAWQGPKTYKSLFAQPAPEAAETTTAPATTPPPAAPGTTPPAAAPGTAPAGGLADSEPLPTAGSDQLLSFSRFSARNPFQPPQGAAVEPGGTGADATVSSAVIEVNGVSETVGVDGAFPAADPIFQLVSLSATAAVIGLTSGAFEGGQANVQVAVGERVELVADDGETYTLTILSVS